VAESGLEVLHCQSKFAAYFN